MVQFYTHRRSKATPAPTTSFDATITSLDAFGQGVTHYQGKTVFVANALPNEHVRIKLIENKRNYAKGVVSQYYTKSQVRCQPQCAHYTLCGGCQQQHIDIHLQRTSKRQALWQLFRSQSRLTLAQIDVISGEDYHYRRRVRFGLQYNHQQQALIMGFRRQASNTLVAINHCPILDRALARLIEPLADCLSHLQAVTQLGHVELVAADNGIIIVLRHLVPLSTADRRRLQTFAHQYQISCYLADGESALVSLANKRPYYQVEGLTLYFNPQGFIQVNREINQQMVAQALAWLAPTQQDIVLDLFCGVGNFSLPLAQQAQKVIAVEGVAELVNLTEQNAIANGLNNLHVYHENLAAENLTQQAWMRYPYTKVLLDPARAGAKEVIPALLSKRPEHIVYVSCNPATLKRDCYLLTQNGYDINAMTLLDMFPHTNHLESMVLLTRR